MGGPGAPARSRAVGSGWRRHKTACDNNKHTVVEPQTPGGKANQEKSGPAESSGQKSGCVSEAAVHLENSHWSEAVVCQESGHLSGAAVHQESGCASEAAVPQATGPAGDGWQVKLVAAAGEEERVLGSVVASMAARRSAGRPAYSSLACETCSSSEHEAVQQRWVRVFKIMSHLATVHLFQTVSRLALLRIFQKKIFASLAFRIIMYRISKIMSRCFRGCNFGTCPPV